MSAKHFPLILQLYRGHTSSELDSFKDYIVHSSENILTTQVEFEKLFSSEESTDESQDDYWNHEYHKLNDIFPYFFRQSTFIGLYSFLENRLYSLCDNLQRIKGYKIKISDLNGKNYIEKSKKYLKLIVGLETDDMNALWNKITEYQKIRNCLVHSNGSINDNQPLYKIVAANSSLELDSNNKIQITSDDFLLSFISIIKDYIMLLYDKIKDQTEFD